MMRIAKQASVPDFAELMRADTHQPVLQQQCILSKPNAAKTCDNQAQAPVQIPIS